MKTVDQKNKPEYSVKYTAITSSRVSASHAFCTICRLDFGVAHGGVYECTKHVNRLAHKLKVNVAKSTKITSFMIMTASREYDVMKADVMLTNFIIEHNLGPENWLKRIFNLYKHRARIIAKCTYKSTITRRRCRGNAISVDTQHVNEVRVIAPTVSPTGCHKRRPVSDI